MLHTVSKFNLNDLVVQLYVSAEAYEKNMANFKSEKVADSFSWTLYLMWLNVNFSSFIEKLK